jgi:hypothetical protein
MGVHTHRHAGRLIEDLLLPGTDEAQSCIRTITGSPKHQRSFEHLGVNESTKLLSDSRMRQLSIGWISAQRRVRASLAISGPDRAYSIARAGRGRTEISSASATAARPRRDRAPTSEAQAALSIHMTMRSFRTRLRLRSATHRRCLAGKPSSTFALSGTRLYGARTALRCGSGKKFRNPTTRTRRHWS